MAHAAPQAGVTRLIVYRIFETKEALYTAVLESATELMATEFADIDLTATTRSPRVVDRLLAVGRQRPEAFRLLWRHAAHEPDFAEFTVAFRKVVDDYALILLQPFVPQRYLPWAAQTATAHVFEGICAWLDVGDPADDEGFRQRHTDGIRAIITAWANTTPD
jgi:AcrR family transcriptional regulator